LDNQRLIELTRRHGRRGFLSDEFIRGNEELLLGLPDGIAWCWTKGSHWRSRITVSVHAHREVQNPTDSAKPGSPTVRMAAGLTS